MTLTYMPGFGKDFELLVGALLFDHPDPSIFTVLTSPSGEEGTANVDFLYHMNVMSEFMVLVYGVYDARPEGLVPSGMSLHNTMLPHGPDGDAYRQAISVDPKPVRHSFMLETRYPQHVTSDSVGLETLQPDYVDCWDGLDKCFTGQPQ